jgi:predicted AAA+ superfamily ATPase
LAIFCFTASVNAGATFWVIISAAFALISVALISVWAVLPWRHKVRDVYLLEKLLYFISDSVGALFSLNSVVSYLKNRVKIRGKEVGFIAEKDNVKIYIQACYLLMYEAVVQREFGNME